jgi:hypothetical protein
MVSERPVDAAILHRLNLFDKWKILIQNAADRKDFESDLVGMSIKYYNVGYQEGRDKEVAEQQKREAGRVLPLEKSNG